MSPYLYKNFLRQGFHQHSFLFAMGKDLLHRDMLRSCVVLNLVLYWSVSLYFGSCSMVQGWIHKVNSDNVSMTVLCHRHYHVIKPLTEILNSPHSIMGYTFFKLPPHHPPLILLGHGSLTSVDVYPSVTTFATACGIVLLWVAPLFDSFDVTLESMLFPI